MAGTRTSPLDGGNLNRSFPGDPRGGPTAQIAHWVESMLLPTVDFVLDLHTGGDAMAFMPSGAFRRLDDPAAMKRAVKLATLFGAPFSYVVRYHKPADDEEAFIKNYVATHPPTLALLPGIRSVIVLLLILRLGSMLSVGFEQYYLQRGAVGAQTAEVLDTFVFFRGIQGGDWGFAAAVGLVRGLVGSALIVAANAVAKRLVERSHSCAPARVLS